jgi:hypothetical protein
VALQLLLEVGDQRRVNVPRCDRPGREGGGGTTEGTGWPEGVPPVGTFVRDTKKNRDAVVMAAIGGYVQLRGIEGGTEWDVQPEKIRPLTAREELSLLDGHAPRIPGLPASIS